MVTQGLFVVALILGRQVMEERHWLGTREAHEGARVEGLKRGQDRRLSGRLQEVQHHQGERVAGQGLLLGLIDAGGFGPRLDGDHQRFDPSIELQSRVLVTANLRPSFFAWAVVMVKDIKKS